MLTDQELTELDCVMVSLALVGHITQVNLATWHTVLNELRCFRAKEVWLDEDDESYLGEATLAKLRKQGEF